MMRRRTFLASSLAAIAAAGAARAQTRAPTIGWLSLSTNEVGLPTIEAFGRGMIEIGYAAGRDYEVLWRFAGGRAEVLPSLAAELVAQRPSVLIGVTSPPGLALAAIERRAPIVIVNMPEELAVAEPIGNPARPLANVTGIVGNTRSAIGKEIELVVELLPGARRVGYLDSTIYAMRAEASKVAEEAAAALNVALVSVPVTQPSDLDGAMSSLAAQHADAVVTPPGTIFTSERTRLASLSASLRLPLVTPYAPTTEAGVLMSYGADNQANYPRAAFYVDRLLRGAAPADLPVEPPARYLLAINLRAARALGLTFPPTILARADMVIE